MSALLIFAISLLQSVAFTVFSRARNRNHIGYQIAASVVSNICYLVTFQALTMSQLVGFTCAAYVAGASAGSFVGASISRWIEQKLDARSDD